MKRIGIILVAMILLLQSVVFADENTVTETEPIVTKDIKFEEAYQLMIENNRELDSITKQIAIQEEIIVEVNNEASRLDGYIYDDEDKITDRANAVYVDPVTEKNQLNALKRSYDDKVFELKQSLVDYYVNYVSQTNQIDLYNQIYAIYEQEYNNKKLELDLGKITDNDLLTYEINLDSAKSDLDNSQRELDLTVMDFNYLINNSLEKAYIPDTATLDQQLSGNYVDLATVDIEKLIERNLEHDDTLASYKEAIEVYEQKKHVESVYTSSVSAYKDYEENIEDNQADTDARIKTIKYGIYTDYNSLKSLLLDIKIAKNNLTLAQSANDVAKVKNELGIVTRIEYIKTQKDLVSAENALTDALNAYYKAYQAFLRYY